METYPRMKDIKNRMVLFPAIKTDKNMKKSHRTQRVLMFILLMDISLTMVGCGDQKTDAAVASIPDNEQTLVTDYNLPPFIIDAHVHYRPTESWEQSFLEVYTRYNAMACLLVSENDVDRGIEFAMKHPDRIIPYVRVHLDRPDVLEYIRKIHSMGFRGLGEVAPGNKYNYDDDRYEHSW